MADKETKAVTITLSYKLSDASGLMGSGQIEQNNIPYGGAVCIQKKIKDITDLLYSWGKARASGEEIVLDL